MFCKAGLPVSVLLLGLHIGSFAHAATSQHGFAWAQACVKARTGLEPLQACTNSMSLVASVMKDALVQGNSVSEEHQAALRAHCSAPHEHPSSCLADMAFQLGLSFQWEDAAGRSAAEAAIAAGEAMCAFDSAGSSCALKGLAALQEAAGGNFVSALLRGEGEAESSAAATPAAATPALCAALRSAGACAVGAVQGLAPLAGSLGRAGAASFLNALPRRCADVGVRLPGAVTGALPTAAAAGDGAAADPSAAASGAEPSMVAACAGLSSRPRACPATVQELYCGLLDDGSAPTQPPSAPRAAVSWGAVAATAVAGIAVLLALVPQPNKASVRFVMDQQQQEEEEACSALQQPTGFVDTPLKASASKGSFGGMGGSGAPSPFARAKSAKGSMADLTALLPNANGNNTPGAPFNGAAAAPGNGSSSGDGVSGQAIGGDAAHLLVSHPLMSLGAPSGSADGLSAALGEIVPLPGAAGEEESADDLIPAFRPGQE